MELVRCILHIMDTAQNYLALSDVAIEKLNEEIEPIVYSKLKRIFKSPNKKQAVFQNSEIEKIIFDYKTTEKSFEDTSKRIAQIFFEEKRKFNLFHSSDFIFAEVRHDNIRYLVGIDNAHTRKLTHTVQTNENTIENNFLLHTSLFSESILKDDRIFIVEYANSSLQLIESSFHGFSLLEAILQCKAEKSYKETVQIMNDSVEKLTDKYDLDELETIPALKSALMESVEEEKLEPQEIAQSVFKENELAKQDFLYEMKEYGIDTMLLENVKPAKSEKTQKIMTDSGIELIIPIDYMKSKEMIEFVTEENGKLSIRLKNIESIQRK